MNSPSVGKVGITHRVGEDGRAIYTGKLPSWAYRRINMLCLHDNRGRMVDVICKDGIVAMCYKCLQKLAEVA